MHAERGRYYGMWFSISSFVKYILVSDPTPLFSLTVFLPLKPRKRVIHLALLLFHLKMCHRLHIWSAFWV